MSKAKAKAKAKKGRKNKAQAGLPGGARLIVDNRKARHRFHVLETLEVGIVLSGSEVKSVRAGRVSLDEAYARVEKGEVFLLGCDIAPYADASHHNHLPKRPRKLLLHRREIRKFAAPARERGLTLVPLKLYFTSRGIAKILLGLCRGKQQHDRREAIKKAETERALRRAYRARTGGGGKA